MDTFWTPKVNAKIYVCVFFLMSGCVSLNEKVDDKIPSVLSQIKLYPPDFTKEHSRSFTGHDYLKFNPQEKLKLLASFITGGQSRGVIIKKNPNFYYSRLEFFYARHPDSKDMALFAVLKTLAVLEYDWEEKNSDKDVLAKMWLGDELYKINKRRIEEKKALDKAINQLQ